MPRTPGASSGAPLEAALGYIALGIPVFPVWWVDGENCACREADCDSQGKHPITASGLKDATTSAKTVRRWWSRYPKAGIAGVCGRESGFIVLDVDPRHGGDASLADLEEKHGALPSGPRSRTGGGGAHRFFKHPGGHVPKVTGFLPGLDLQADGSYVVLPPSGHVSGGVYGWEKPLQHPERLPFPPGWLLKLAASRPARKKAAPGNDEPIPEGRRNDALASIAGRLRRAGASEEAILTQLRQENATRCRPPLPDHEVEAIAGSIARYEPGKAEHIPEDAPEDFAAYLGTFHPASDEQRVEAEEEYKTSQDLRNIVATIRDIPTKEIKAWKRDAKVCQLIFEVVRRIGRFYRTADEDLFWFRNFDRRLYDVLERGPRRTGLFPRIVSLISGINLQETLMKQVVGLQQVLGFQQAELVEVHRMSHWDPVNGVMYIDRFDGSLYRLDGKEIRVVPNGEGALFLPESRAEPVEASGSDIKALERFLDLLNVDETYGLTEREAKKILRYWLLAFFFKSTQPTRMVLCFWGEKGTGKTTSGRSIGWVLLGGQFDVATITPDNQETFDIKVTNTAFAVFDNADGSIRWLPDKLATAATGGQIPKRRLYTTNELATYDIEAWLVITSRDPRFGRDDVGERLLILPTERPTAFRKEGDIRDDILTHRAEIWGGLLESLQEAIRLLGTNPQPSTVSFRMADFASFIIQLQTDDKGRKEIGTILTKVSHIQDLFIAHTALRMEWVEYLVRVLEYEDLIGIRASEIAEKIKLYVKQEGLLPLRNLSAVSIGTFLTNEGKHLSAIGAEISSRMLKGTRRYDLRLRRPGEGEPPSAQRMIEEPDSSETTDISEPSISVTVNIEAGRRFGRRRHADPGRPLDWIARDLEKALQVSYSTAFYQAELFEEAIAYMAKDGRTLDGFFEVREAAGVPIPVALSGAVHVAYSEFKGGI